jgi:EEF1A lysine methyltransferase 4
VDKGHKILNVGAGNSRLSEEMFEEGYTQITNIDISNVCVKAMKEKYKEKPETFKYLLMDARAMDFPEASFDAVIDKATIDSILVTDRLSSAEKTPQPMAPR